MFVFGVDALAILHFNHSLSEYIHVFFVLVILAFKWYRVTLQQKAGEGKLPGINIMMTGIYLCYNELYR